MLTSETHNCGLLRRAPRALVNHLMSEQKGSDRDQHYAVQHSQPGVPASVEVQRPERRVRRA